MTAPAVNSVVDPFKADANSVPTATSTKLTSNTGFTFGSSTPKTADDEITKPVTPVSDHSDGNDNYGNDGSFQYSLMPAVGKPGITDLKDIRKESEPTSDKDAPGPSDSASTTKPAPSADLNPTGVFSSIPGLGQGVNASSPTKSSLVAKPTPTFTPLDGATLAKASTTDTIGTTDKEKDILGGPVAGEKRKADDKVEDTKVDDLKKPEEKPVDKSNSLHKPEGTASRSLQATMEDFDSSAEAKTPEPPAKKAKIDEVDASANPAETEKPAEVEKSAETEAPAAATEKKKPGRPKKGQAKKKAPAPVGQTARKTRSQGPAA